MKGEIRRDPRGAASSSYDLVVVGGGIYGAMTALEAARRGLSVLLLERSDFGGATTWNSLRIVHGGLRYLQGLDLRRFRESVGERSWLLRRFPDLVAPLPCLMPLYRPARGGRLRRRSAFRLALAANELLAGGKEAGRRGERPLPRGRLLGVKETLARFPGADRDGLRGAALWYDATAPDSQRLLVEILRWAASCGARLLNYVEAEELLVEAGGVAGVAARDRVSGERLEVRARWVLNCAGPWSRQLSRRFDRDLPELFRPLLAFNLFLDMDPPSDAALAVAGPTPGAQTWFLLPWQGRVLAGTFYVPRGGEPDLGKDGPGEAEMSAFLGELDAALPGLGKAPVLGVHWGWLPAAAEGSAEPASRPVVHDHGRHGGPEGLVSVSGVKLTTARAVAHRALAPIFQRQGRRLPEADGRSIRPPADPPIPLERFARLAARDRVAAHDYLRSLMERQSVVQLEDLLLRRTDWGTRPGQAAAAEALCQSLLAELGILSPTLTPVADGRP
jgi:glycerol-3-phosphate dehydrogenase